MKNISGQYQDLLEGKMTQAQFLRNARMMFPSFVTQHNSFNDSVAILKQKGMLNEGDAVKGTPDKEPTYEPTTPDDKIKYKKVEQSPEVDEQDGIYPATSIKDVPKKAKTYKKVKNTSDGLEPIKDNDTKNEMKKVKVVKEGLGDAQYYKAITAADSDKTPMNSIQAVKKFLKNKFKDLSNSNIEYLAKEWAKRALDENISPEEIEDAEVEITTNDSSIQNMADKLGVSQEELFKLLLKKLGGLKENEVSEGKMNITLDQFKNAAQKNPKIFQASLKKAGVDPSMPPSLAFNKLSDSQKQQVYNSVINTKLDAVIDKKLSESVRKKSVLEQLVTKIMSETLAKKSAR